MRLIVAAVLVVAAAACGSGGGEGDVLADAEEHLAAVRSGRMMLEMTASTGEGDDGAGPVGFRVEGPFSFESGDDLAVVDLTYTRMLDEEHEVSVASDGEQAWVVSDGEVAEVAADQLGALRLGEGDDRGVPDLDIAAWVEDPVVEERGDETVVTGELDVAELLDDLQRLAAEIGGEAGADGAGGVAGIDDETAGRLQELVRGSEVEVVTEGDEHHLRSLHASVDFGATVPPELQDALGAFAGARLELTVTLEELDGDLKVERPTS